MRPHCLRPIASSSSFARIDEFGPQLRQEAIRRGLALATQVVLLIDGASALANMGRLCFPKLIQIVDFYHALEHAGRVLVALLGSKEHPNTRFDWDAGRGCCSTTA